mmetsp:Transcript_46914/g.109657  ORF Transcript_46914/g.109657 Transcript_46914/m.109657 type:complete len:325 (+) Transcript_46914:821-1795(+)
MRRMSWGWRAIARWRRPLRWGVVGGRMTWMPILRGIARGWMIRRPIMWRWAVRGGPVTRWRRAIALRRRLLWRWPIPRRRRSVGTRMVGRRMLVALRGWSVRRRMLVPRRWWVAMRSCRRRISLPRRRPSGTRWPGIRRGALPGRRVPIAGRWGRVALWCRLWWAVPLVARRSSPPMRSAAAAAASSGRSAAACRLRVWRRWLVRFTSSGCGRGRRRAGIRLRNAGCPGEGLAIRIQISHGYVSLPAFETHYELVSYRKVAVREPGPHLIRPKRAELCPTSIEVEPFQRFRVHRVDPRRAGPTSARCIRHLAAFRWPGTSLSSL